MPRFAKNFHAGLDVTPPAREEYTGMMTNKA